MKKDDSSTLLCMLVKNTTTQKVVGGVFKDGFTEACVKDVINADNLHHSESH